MQESDRAEVTNEDTMTYLPRVFRPLGCSTSRPSPSRMGSKIGNVKKRLKCAPPF